ncbi:hypothetical protein [Tunturiibacter gelidoferens]|jgi:hypothetical protein|uniref:Uncharacterized protein n=1 Tax=Tunturiibacter gelidiferens TaxID=3069689 RepID=A0A9X0U4P8_9BACT|nr:hypothetical protein [Edaphobacter lichenicola]MBB5329185.1 hypothetical protein [Edaphobacter lichenicola]
MLSFGENTADNGILTLTYLADVDDSKKLSLGISAPLLEAIVNASLNIPALTRSPTSALLEP